MGEDEGLTLFHQQSSLQPYLQMVEQLTGTGRGDGREHVEIDLRPDDRCGAQRGGGGPRTTAPLLDSLTNGGRHLLVGIRRGQFHQEQGVAPAACVQLRGPLGSHDQLGVLQAEWTQGDGRRTGKGHAFFRPLPGHDRHPTVRQPASHLTEPSGGGGVGEMDIVDDQHQGLSLRLSSQDTEECGEQQCLSGSRVGERGQLRRSGRFRLRTEERSQHGDVRTEDLHESGAPGAADQCLDGVQQRLQGQGSAEFVARDRDDLDATADQPLCPELQQPRLPDPRLPFDHCDLPVPALGAVDQVIQRAEGGHPSR